MNMQIKDCKAGETIRIISYIGGSRIVSSEYKIGKPVEGDPMRVHASSEVFKEIKLHILNQCQYSYKGKDTA